MLNLTAGKQARQIWLTLLLASLAACSKHEAKPIGGGTPNESAAPAIGAAVSAQARSMGIAQLRASANQALQENRMYAPAGDNAVEYYLALHEKQPQDTTVDNALTDLMPYTVIAAEQSISHGEFAETQRLIALIEKMDPAAPALPRLRKNLAASMQTIAKRSEQKTERIKKQAEQKIRQANTQNPPSEQPDHAAATAQQQIAPQHTTEAGLQGITPRTTEQVIQPATPLPAPTPAAVQSLRPINTPAPRYPSNALRAGISGEVVLELTVGTDGSITASRVLRATPPFVFDREVLNAVKRWRFEPVPVPVTTRRTLSFHSGK